MASPIVLTYKGETAKFQHKKLDRSKLYGTRRRVPLDAAGKRCERAEVTEDGELLLRAGMTAQGYFDEGDRWIPSAELAAVSDSGEILDKAPSTLGVPCEMVESTPEALLDLKVSSVYLLEPEEMSEAFKTIVSKGTPFRFPFNYRADFHLETAFLVSNDQGCFAIVGNLVETKWLSLDQVVEENAADEDDDDGDLDFEMF